MQQTAANAATFNALVWQASLRHVGNSADEMRRLTIVLFFLFVVAALAGRAGAQEVPSVDALRAKIAAATGTPPPPATFERISYTLSGLEGTQTTVRAGDDFRETDGFGPLQRATGRYQKQDWHQNANGQTVLEVRDPGVAIEDTYTTTVRRVSTGESPRRAATRRWCRTNPERSRSTYVSDRKSH